MTTTKTETSAVETAEVPAMVIRQPQPTQESWLKADGYIASLTDLFRQDPAGFRPVDREQVLLLLRDNVKRFSRRGSGGGPKGPGIGAFVAEQVKAGASPAAIIREGALKFPGSALEKNGPATVRAHVGREHKLGHLTDEQVARWRAQHAPAAPAKAKAAAKKPAPKAESKKPVKVPLTSRAKMPKPAAKQAASAGA